MNSIPRYSVINFDDKVEVFKTNGVITSVRIFDKIYKTIPEEKIVEEFERNNYIRFIYFTLRHRKRENNNSTDEFFYIGQHKTPIKHLIFKYFGSGKIVSRMYKQHPEEFEKCYLMSCNSDDEMNEREHEIISDKLIQIKPYCLNIVEGGSYPNWIKVKNEDEIRRIYSKSSKSIKKYLSEHPERKKQMSENAKLFFKNHPEIIKKISLLKKEYFRNEENRKNISLKIKEWYKNNTEKMQQKQEKSRNTFMERYSSPISMYDISGNYIKTFESLSYCAEYLINVLKLTAKLSTIKSKISDSVDKINRSSYGYYFKHFDKNPPLKLSLPYSPSAFVVYSIDRKPIYVFHSIKEFHKIISPYIKINSSMLKNRIDKRDKHNSPFMNLHYKYIRNIQKEELNNIFKKLINSKETDVLKFIEFSGFTTKQSNPK